MDEINIIFIHYHFPPIKNSGVYRNYFLSHALLTYSTSAHLITTSNQNMFPKEELPISDKLIQHVIQTLDYRTVAAWFKGKNNVTAGTQFSENTKSTLLFKWLIKLQRSFPFNLLIAEGALLYILSSYFKTVKIIKEQNINVVFSSFMPYADHISAWMIKMRFPGIV
jgi:hypothetical protein